MRSFTTVNGYIKKEGTFKLVTVHLYELEKQSKPKPKLAEENDKD